MDAADWGDVPTWIAAVVALAALVAGWIAARAAWHVLQVERRRDEVAEAERRSAQAAKVSAWFSSGAAVENASALILNRSDTPIWKVHVTWWRNGQLRSQTDVAFLTPAETAQKVFAGDDLRVASHVDRYGHAVYTEPLSGFDVSIEFTDSANVRWRRTVDGTLSEV